jgi:ribosomal protein S18 acetylase RimI-like enzyme
MNIRSATRSDLARVAQLHAERITEGFLPTLGLPFLERLYARVLAGNGFVLVATDDIPGTAVGFCAGTPDIGHLYRQFLLRDGFVAGLRAAPRIVRALPRVVETLRYPGADDDTDLPSAEILAVAVAGTAAGRGVGSALLDASTSRFTDLGITSAKVVTTPDNEAALALYRRGGFVSAARVAVHSGTTSEVLVWKRP